MAAGYLPVTFFRYQFGGLALHYLNLSTNDDGTVTEKSKEVLSNSQGYLTKIKQV